MPSRAFVCLWCQCNSIFAKPSSQLMLWPQRRGLATAMRQRKKPARMTLAKDVARSTVPRSKVTVSDTAGPFRGMNQTEARIPDERLARERAALRRHSLALPKSMRRPTMRSQRIQSSTLTQPTSSEAGVRPKTERDEKPLFHALKMQATLTPLSYNQRAILKEKLDKITSFEQFGLRSDVSSAIYTQALAGMTDLVPTPIQKLAIPALLSKKGHYPKEVQVGEVENKFDQFLLAAETGSGKTLAYLLPVIDCIKRQEDLDTIEQSETKAQAEKKNLETRASNCFELDPPELTTPVTSTQGRPKALILLPTSELVAQVGRVAKSLSHTVKYRSAAISSSTTPTVIRSRLFNANGIDIVISTPHLISSIAEKDPNILSRIQHIVVDEADSLLDRSFAPITCSVIERATPSLKQLILCSATIPRSLDTFVDKRFPSIIRLVTPKLHSIPRRVQLGVIDIDKEPYRGNRNLACADIIWTIGRTVHEDTGSHHTVKSMLVFVNEREKADEVAQFLASKGVEAVALTRDTPEQRQAEILSAFTSASRVEGDEKEPKDAKAVRQNFRDFIPFDKTPDILATSGTKRPKRLPNTRVLVTTDLGSRGIDTLAVRHVILYDVPHTTIDFVHRLGRTGRMGRRGRGIVLVGKNDRKDVVREVKDAMFQGKALI